MLTLIFSEVSLLFMYEGWFSNNNSANNLRASSPFGAVTRNHARIAREKGHQCIKSFLGQAKQTA